MNKVLFQVDPTFDIEIEDIWGKDRIEIKWHTDIWELTGLSLAQGKLTLERKEQEEDR